MSPNTVSLYFPGKLLLSILGATAARFARNLTGLHVHYDAVSLQPMSSYYYTGSSPVTMPGRHGKMSPDTVCLYFPGKLLLLSILGATAARFARKLTGLHVNNHAVALQPMSSY